jgi:Immunity protein Imm6
MNQLTNLQSLSIRGQVAYLLCIAESIFPAIDENTDGSVQARAGLDKCWEWLSGRSTVTGYDIYYFLANENDTGLDVYTCELDEQNVLFFLWGVIIYVIAYTTWRAYNLDGEIYLPQDIESIDEKTVDDIFEYLKQIPSFDEKYALNLKNKLIDQFPFDPENQFGNFISKDEVCN